MTRQIALKVALTATLALTAACGAGADPDDADAELDDHAFAAGTASCKLPAYPTSGVQVAHDVAYIAGGGSERTLDIARPAGAAAHPLVVLIHGGSWKKGDKRYKPVKNLMMRLAGLGYAAASIDYRLVDGKKNVFPAAVSDVRCAVRYLENHAADYGIDPTRVGVWGQSAGAHLALMLGLAHDADALDDGTCPEPGAPAVDAVAAWYAPSYLGSLGSSEVAADVEAFAAGKLGAASPSHYVSADDPPVLLAHGTHDAWVPVAQSRALAALLAKHHVDHAYVEVPGALHGFYPLGGDASEDNDDPGPDPADYYQSHPGVTKALRRAQCALVGFLDAQLHP